MWGIKGSLGNLVIYVENPEKTINPDFYKDSAQSDKDRQTLSDVIDYATSDEKTTAKLSLSHEPDTVESFITGIMCSPANARDEMMAVKEKYNKKFGIIAFHGYQSFAENEVTPQIAHEIGIKLAQELCGDRFQVIIATHLDKKHHIHNHFVLNSVSFLDGKKFNMCKKAYREMRSVSDKLCEEYGLSVIENPEKEGQISNNENDKIIGEKSWKSIIKEDVDNAIAEAMTDREFFSILKEQGYEIKSGKDISVRPPGKDRFMRLARNFGEDYRIENINKRILSEDGSDPTPKKNLSDKVIPDAITLPNLPENCNTGYYGIYASYYYKLNTAKAKLKGRNGRMHFLLREDLSKLDKIYAEMTLLRENNIDTKEQLFSYKKSTEKKIQSLTKKRNDLRNKLRHIGKSGNIEIIKSEISRISTDLKFLRSEVKRCDNIVSRSYEINEKTDLIAKENEDKNKEAKHGQFRRDR